jgi:hypothetical protein
MTLEACITKMMILLGRYTDQEKVRDLFIQNMAGERSVLI